MRVAEFAQIPVEFANVLSQLFIKGGYTWPDDLIKAFTNKPFEKANTSVLDGGRQVELQ